MIVRLVSVLLLGVLTACANGYVQPSTSGPHAIIKVRDIIEGGHELANVLYAVDGQLVNVRGSIAVTPGVHKVVLRGYDTPMYNAWTPYRQGEVTLEAQANRTYSIELGTDENQRLMVRLVDEKGRAASDSARFMRFNNDGPHYRESGIGFGIGAGSGGFGIGTGIGHRHHYGYPYYPY